MKNRIVRIIITAIAVEALTVLSLVVLVAAFGPSDPEGAQKFAQWLGFLVGPVGGFFFCLLGGWFVARGLPQSPILNGCLLGIAVALIDVTILLASGPEFHPVFVISNVGRIIAGALGGWLARSSRIPEWTGF